VRRQSRSRAGSRRNRVLSSADNNDRWLVSYADFVTLLFAFFVVMFASAQADKSHARAVSESIQRALHGVQASTKVVQQQQEQKKAQPAQPEAMASQELSHPSESPEGSPAVTDLSEAMRVLDKNLRNEVEKGSVRLSLEQRGLVISLEAGAFFSSGTDGIPASAYPAVQKVADVLNQVPNQLRLEGHTDSLPISNSRFQSNWELSAGRSIAMLRLLCERFQVDSRRMAMVGYADNDAIDRNDTESGRGRNRRVDIVIVNEKSDKISPRK
jgi:chemotaxis protein MotB